MGMEADELLEVNTMRDRIKRILPDLKLVYANAKYLESRHMWDLDSWNICEAYMTLADAYIGILDSLEEEGGEK